MRKILKALRSRLAIVGLATVIQIGWITFALWELSDYYPYMDMVVTMVSIVVCVQILNKWDNPSYKLAWCCMLLLFPMFGLIIYVIFGRSGQMKRKYAQFEKIYQEYAPDLRQDQEVAAWLEGEDGSIARQSGYIEKWGGFPVYRNTDTNYYPSGEEMFPDMLEALRSAEHYIFLEFFIVAEGYMWSAILEILEQKAKEGVDVRLIYDDVGCVNRLPARYYKTLRAMGIKCAVFNPFWPFLSIMMNNRDHRKIIVVDGHTGFTGGINLADEYINRKERFGYWKDTGIRLRGEAVWNLTVMFLEMWAYTTRCGPEHDPFKPHVHQQGEFEAEGYVQPYCDSPLDYEKVGESVYLNIINRARKYVYIFTPYLVIGNEMITALCIAAKSGVDVRIVVPGIPDKKPVFWMSQSYYAQLISAGIQIYQFTPGFLHAKCFVSDDEVATCGTINMDFRSLYLHFECGVWMYRTKAVMQIKEDMLQTISQSARIGTEFCRKRSLLVKSVQSILKIFSPLV